MFGFFDMGFTLFSVFFTIMFVVIISIFVIIIGKGIKEWNTNNHSPRLTVDATVVAKRTNVSRHHHSHGTGMGHTSTSTTYYVTFQVASGDRMELRMSGTEYGLLIEGDEGKLSFQGTRYLSFDRI